jgi:REP element-mobilizing transposase RayT
MPMRPDNQPTGTTPPLPPRGWHSRGYLPHFDSGDESPQSVTFRLADSVPARVIEQWVAELQMQPNKRRDVELRKRIETFLDTGYGACHLQDARIGSVVEGALLFFDDQRYRLQGWTVMPNHVHVLFTPMAGWSMSNIVESWKSFISNAANKLLGRSGQFWQEDYFDRFIRDAEHFTNALDYIEANPVKAGLCAFPHEWPFGSAIQRHSISKVGAAGMAAVPGENQ